MTSSKVLTIQVYSLMPKSTQRFRCQNQNKLRVRKYWYSLSPILYLQRFHLLNILFTEYFSNRILCLHIAFLRKRPGYLDLCNEPALLESVLLGLLSYPSLCAALILARVWAHTSHVIRQAERPAEQVVVFFLSEIRKVRAKEAK